MREYAATVRGLLRETTLEHVSSCWYVLTERGQAMEIRGIHNGHVTLTPLFRDEENRPMPAIYLSCEMAANDFSGATEPDEPMVAIEVASLRQFVADMRVLERDRHGTAMLTCMSRRELTLSVHIYDRAGHALLTAELGQWKSVGGGHWHSVALAFEIDPTSLPGMVRDFEDLLAFPRPER